MDQSTRNTLRNVVTQCRKLLEESVAQVLQGQFGIYATGKKDEVQIEPEARMSHLSEEDRAYRQDLLDHYEHIKALGYKAKDALAQLIREVAFTHLNRFCAYRMMESRGLIRESVSKGLKSQGFLFYLADHEEDERRFNTGQQDIAYRHFLNWLGGTLSEEIGVLFAPTDPANRLYPPQRVIDQVLGLLNDPDLAGIWSEDEAIGWVYQFFIPSDLKDRARKQSSAPQNSYELAFRNQFFTPRYVVEFLVDNTLGRLWLEMRSGNTRLRSVCTYLACSEDSQLIERTKKDPREIRILDPACGSGHFLLYCFDLLLIIYEEAYEDAELGTAFREAYPTLDDLRRDIPRLILTHNLHGVDIDPRAAQIAALALWLRCQRAYADMRNTQARPRITRTNVVCAEPMPGNADLLTEFVRDLRPAFLGRVVEGVFDSMQLAAEAGSLLQIENEIRRSISEAHQEWLNAPALHQKELFADLHGQQKPPPTTLSDIKDQAFFEQAESLVVKALEEYARRTEGTERHRRRLFATDALRGFAFIDVCRTRFDVILMNPPFGEPSKPSRQYLYSTLPSARQDILAAFIERWVPTITPGGFLGALTNRLILVKDLLHDWRRTFLLGGSSCMTLVADLGYGVLDEAVVEAAAYVLQKIEGTPQQKCEFISLLDRKDKHSTLSGAVRTVQNLQPSERVFRHTLSAFRRLPKERIAYWCADQWLSRFETNRCAKDFGIVAKKGLETGRDFELLRLFWEVDASDLVPLVSWTGYSKGGSYRPLNTDVHLVYDWRRRNDARRTSNEELYGLPGLTYTERTTSNFSARLLPAGNVFSPKGPGIFDTASKCPWGLLGWLNSSVVCFYLELLVGGGDTSAAGTAARDFSPTLIETMPVPFHFRELLSSLAPLTQEMHEALEAFRTPENSWLYTGYTGTSASIRTNAHERFIAYEKAVLRTVQLYEQVDALVCDAYELSETEAADIRKYLGHPYPTGNEVSEEHRRVIASAFSVSDSQNDEEEEEDIQDCKGEEVQSRAIAKLSYIADGRYEGLSVRTGLSPRVIADTRMDLVGVPETEMLDEARHVLSFAAGVAFNRWNLFPSASSRTDAFAALPCIQPASVQGPSDTSNTGPRVSSLRGVIGDGLLVDDVDHESDIVVAVRRVLEMRWGQHGESLESEACDSLGQRTLREYFRKPSKGGFWDDHVSRYSKSRRKAPIYWLLQSSKKNYAIWLYYHRLDKDILFKALVNCVEPKIRLETDRLESLRAQKGEGGTGKATKKLDKEIEKQEDFLSELRDFEEKLRRVAELRLVPDLNDGVVLNIAPLHELVPWKEAEKYWEELLEGRYEWSSIGKQLREKGLVK